MKTGFILAKLQKIGKYARLICFQIYSRCYYRICNYTNQLFLIQLSLF